MTSGFGGANPCNPLQPQVKIEPQCPTNLGVDFSQLPQFENRRFATTDQKQTGDAQAGTSVVVRRDFISLTKSLPVATLLSQIVYWHSPSKKTGKDHKMTVVREGAFWIAKTREEWCEETGLSLDQYKLALTKLKAMGLVKTKIMKFHCLTQTHLQMDMEALSTLIKGTDGPKRPIPLVAKTPSQWGVSHHPSGGFHTTPIVTEITSETTAVITFCAATSADAETSGKETKNNQGKKMPGAKEIYKNLQDAMYGNKGKQPTAVATPRLSDAFGIKEA